VARDAGLRDGQDVGELGDIETVVGENAEQTEPRRVSEEPEERRRSNHIAEST